MDNIARGPWQAPQKKTFEEFRPFSPIAWEGEEAPRVDYIVQDCFVRGTVAILAGDGGLGKSLLCQQLLTACWTGADWLGHRTVKSRGLAVFCEEERDELHRRQQAINAHYNCDMTHLEGVQFEARAGRDSILMEFRQWGGDGRETAMFDQVDFAAGQHGAQIIVLDTVADVFSGNEIDRNQPRTFIRRCRRLAIKHQATVILTQHPSNEGLSSGSGKSGSTGWHNSARSRLYLTKPKAKDDAKPDPDARLLKTMKANYGRSDGSVELRWRDGVFQLAATPPAASWTDW